MSRSVFASGAGIHGNLRYPCCVQRESVRRMFVRSIAARLQIDELAKPRLHEIADVQSLLVSPAAAGSRSVPR